MSELRVLKLINGDEIIGFVEDGINKNSELEDLTVDHLLFVKGAMKIVQEYNKETRGHSIYLVDWMPSARSAILPIPKDKVITMDFPQDVIEEHYLELMTFTFDVYDTEQKETLTPEETKKIKALEKLKSHKRSDDEDVH